MLTRNGFTPAERGIFFCLRRHGATVRDAAHKAGLTEDQGYRLERKSYCAECGDYVADDDCAHWDYESGV